MSFIDRLLRRGEAQKPRTRICVECGMPIAEHKEWCSILRTQRERDARTAAARDTTTQPERA